MLSKPAASRLEHPKTLPSTCVITAHELTRKHGTGAQLLNIYEGEKDFVHFFWHTSHSTERDPSNSIKLSMWPSTRRFIRRPVLWASKLLGTAWWYGNTVNINRFKRLTARLKPFDIAHVIVSDDDSAAKAKQLLQVIGCPYVVQLYDLLHEDGLSSEAQPSFTSLLRESKCCMALTPSLADEAKKFCSNVKIVGIGLSDRRPRCLLDRPVSPVRVVISGRPYSGGCKLLEDSLPVLRERGIHLEIHYVGAFFCDLPDSLKSITKDWGFLDSDSAYLELLSSMTIGYLTGPHKDDCFGRYSFPSRASDLLMAGVPLIGNVSPRSATAGVFRELLGKGVFIVRSPADVADSIEEILATHAAASSAARGFAERNFSIESVRDAVFRELRVNALSHASA